MNIDGPDASYHFKGALMPPTSLRALPKFPTPNKEQSQAATELERSLIQQSGIVPGTYTRLDDLSALIDVHDRLWDHVEGELLKHDSLVICKHLYEKLEVIYGHLLREKYQTAEEQILTGRTRGSEKRLDLWRAITPITEGIKFLLEMAVKWCGDRGSTSGALGLDFIIGLSSSIVTLDNHLDSIHYQIVPYEIIIAPDFSLHGGIRSEANAAIDEFEKHEKTHMAQADRDFLDQQNKGFHDRIKGQEIKADDFRTFPEFVTLDQAMTEELDYGIFDYLGYVKGCMSLFGEKEYLKIITVPGLAKLLRRAVGLNREKVESLLRDHALSQATVKALTRKDMMPYASYKRDSRLLRRPLVEISHKGTKTAVMGVEVFSIGMQVFYDALQYGTLQMPSMQREGAVRSAMGVLSAKIGAPFRDNIASKCIEMGFRATTEWPISKKDQTNQPVGPIDILVIDQRKRRFILVEAKNLQSQGIVPKEMKGQRDRFLGTEEKDDQAFVKVLRYKEQAFTSNKEWQLHELKYKLKMDGLQDYTVEGVIVVFHPVLWPLFAKEPLPILDDLEFYERLESGQPFLTTPIAM